MNAMRQRQLALLATLVVVAVVLFGPATLQQRATADDKGPRDVFVHDAGNDRYIKDMGKGHWVEFRNGKKYRDFKETDRNKDYIQIDTEEPQPTTTRLYHNHVTWRTVGDPPGDWRKGDTGHWKK